VTHTESPMAQLTYTAPDISCGHCKATIESELAQAPGVQRVEVDVDSRQVRVDYDEAATGDEVLRAQLEEIGYPVG
jgi:copper chaperone